MYTGSSVDVSFCLPCYGVGSYVEDCLNSILEQPFGDINYEIICIDDCSRDDTYDVLVRLSQQYEKIKIYRNEQNKGVSYTRNKMIDIAKGQYIWFVDPDDLLINGAVCYVKKAQEYNADVLLGNYVKIKEDGTHPFDLSNNCFSSDKIERTDRFTPVDVNGNTMSACWAGVFKRDFLNEHALRFNEKMIAQEDTLFYYQFPMKTQRIYKAQTYCYLYRIRSTSVMHSRDTERMKKYYFSMLEMLRVYQAHYAERNYDNEELLKDKILHSKQNVATCLASIGDDAFVKEQMRILKNRKLYPFPFRTKTLTGKESMWLRILNFLIPIEIVFYLYRLVFRIKYKKEG